MTVIGVGIGAPLGLFAGTYLAGIRQARQAHLGDPLHQRHLADARPSIIIGLFIYGAVVVPMGGFSALAGSLALAVIVIPVVVRTTEDMLGLVPNPLREAASRARPAALAGHQADRLSRSPRPVSSPACCWRPPASPVKRRRCCSPRCRNQFFSLDLTKTMANLPVTINNFVQSPYDYWKQLAWSGALLITLTVLALNIGARILGAERTAK